MSTKKDLEKQSCRHGREDGFTLVELLVVLAIIGLMAALVAPRVLRYLGSARADTTKAQIRNIGAALELFNLDTGSYPSSELGLKALVSAPPDGSAWSGPYLKGSKALVDAWGNDILYETSADTKTITIKSLGQDGKEQGEGLDLDIELAVQ